MESLYQLRKAKGLTQQEIAEKLNVAQGCVSHWENGYNRPTVKYWEPLAKILGVTVEEIRDCLPGHPPASERKYEI
jgi:transcriptional regulator with XRE-family HTH domain